MDLTKHSFKRVDSRHLGLRHQNGDAVARQLIQRFFQQQLYLGGLLEGPFMLNDG